MHLGVALDAGQTLVYDTSSPGTGAEYADPHCGRGDARTPTTFDCFFQPLSTCTDLDARADPVTATITGADSRPVEFKHAPQYWRRRLAELYPQIQLSEAFYKYWWRAQSAAYLMRLNAATSSSLEALRTNQTINKVSAASAEIEVNFPYPLPPGVQSLHVRHGDKGQGLCMKVLKVLRTSLEKNLTMTFHRTEMTLVPLDEYISAAIKRASQNPLGMQNRLFVSSEDPEVIVAARSIPGQRRGPPDAAPITGPTADVVVFTTDIPRLNTGPLKQIAEFGRSRMTIFWLLQLTMALECDGFYGTRGSNWNRLIDELRCVWIDRCGGTYFEVGLDKDWVNYEW
ncbi:hypothetical protein HDU89_003703 [Geranomyces variabilis]|nr:hypothetical protein HDU89_003703 [Geranomyces variabilis]